MSCFGYRFDDLPKGWTDQTVYTFNGPMVDDTAHLLILTIDRRLDSGTTLDAYVAFRVKGILDMLPGGKVEKNAEMSLERFRVHELTVRWTANPTLQRYTQFYFAVVDERGYTFTCSYSETSFKSMREAVREQVGALLAETL